MSDYQVTCIRRDSSDTDRRIDRLGGPGWSETIDTVIIYIQRGTHRFWTTAGGTSTWVIVKQHPVSRRYYLATEADSSTSNNLLSLPECP